MVSYQRYDALIIGARCAGAATAMLMARVGMRVLLVDRGSYGADTISTHALMRGAVLQLHRWGILPRLREAGTPAVRTTTFHYGDEQITVPIKASHGVDALYAPRRTLLDSALVDAAWEAGAQVRHGYTLVRLARRADGSVCGGVLLDAGGAVIHVAADFVIGADGAGSTVAQLTGAEIRYGARHTSAVLYGYSRSSTWKATTGGIAQRLAPGRYQPTVANIASSRRCRRGAYRPPVGPRTAEPCSAQSCRRPIRRWRPRSAGAPPTRA
ncbi:MAG: FAD-dependent oxidoreductase [Rhodopila sp.]